MGKSVFIAEKPSVAREFAKALKYDMKSRDGYMESEEAIVTWCVGHLVTMSYPEAYDEKWKRWTMEPLPFLPKEFKYEVIEPVKKQFKIVSDILNRPDVDVIYVCTDSGREGEYIYRLVEMQANVTGKDRRRVWIDSQTEEEIRRGKTLRSAMDAGFGRAFVTIFDSNVTTLMAAAILFYLGTGPIKGFAVTLALGVLLSMFTAITVTKYLLRFLIYSRFTQNPWIFGVAAPKADTAKEVSK